VPHCGQKFARSSMTLLHLTQTATAPGNIALRVVGTRRNRLPARSPKHIRASQRQNGHRGKGQLSYAAALFRARPSPVGSSTAELQALRSLHVAVAEPPFEVALCPDSSACPF